MVEGGSDIGNGKILSGHSSVVPVIRAQWRTFRLPFRAGLQTSKQMLRERVVRLLELEDEAGFSGYGESAPLGGVASSWVADGHALNQALLDLLSRRQNLPLASVLGGGCYARRLWANALLSSMDPEGAAREAADEVARGFRCLKLKVGFCPETDLERIRAVRRAVGSRVEIRTDANGAWSVSQALRAAKGFQEEGVALLEQPVASNDLQGLAAVRQSSGISIGVDEAVTDWRDLQRVLALGAADVLVLKPMRSGGPGPAVMLGCLARASGLQIIVTTALDGAVGRAGAVHVAAVLEAVAEPGNACQLLEWLQRLREAVLGLWEARRNLPAWAGDLPAWAGDLPAWAGDLPAWAGDLPAWAGDLPAWAGGIPARAAGNTSRAESLGNLAQGVLEKPHSDFRCEGFAPDEIGPALRQRLAKPISHGLATAGFLARDICLGIPASGPIIEVPPGPGLGFSP